MGHINIGIIFLFIGIPNDSYTTLSQFWSGWLFNTQSRVMQADWLMLENNEMANLNNNMPFNV